MYRKDPIFRVHLFTRELLDELHAEFNVDVGIGREVRGLVNGVAKIGEVRLPSGAA